MRYLILAEVLDLHRRVIEEAGGALGLRDLGCLAVGCRAAAHEALADHRAGRTKPLDPDKM